MLNPLSRTDSEEEEEMDEEEEEDGETPVFDSKLDVDRFQSYIHRAAAQVNRCLVKLGHLITVMVMVIDFQIQMFLASDLCVQ